VSVIHEAPPLLSTARLPRVDLMPPEFAQRRRERRILASLSLVVLAAVAIVAVLYVAAVHGKQAAQQSLDDATAKHTALSHQLAKLGDVQKTYDEQSRRQALLEQALAPEVHWSGYLADLSLRIPDNVWLTNMSVTENVDDANQVTTGSGDSDSSLVPSGIGTITFGATAFHHTDVANWLEAMAGERGFLYPYFSNSSKSKIGHKDTVTFSSKVILTKDALCGKACAEPTGDGQ
jgi:Tfp pilus assembly protein PilN